MSYIIEEIKTNTQKGEHLEFLKRFELTYEDSDYTIGLYDMEKLIGCCSLSASCIKLLAIDEGYQGQGLTNQLISHMLKRLYQKGLTNVFIFTKPEKEFEFTHLGFTTIIKTEDVLFLEKRKDGISSYANNLKNQRVEGSKIASIVMNLNPFTLGHRSLIERAARETDHVHVFIVKEDKSVFPYDIRIKLLREGTKDLSNVTIHEGSDYIISSATFPTYFIKSKKKVEIPRIYARVDALIFKEYVVKPLGITCRYVGSEPLSKTTNMYNGVLREVLGDEIDVIEVPRTEINGRVISASYVRNFIREGNLQEAYKLLPISTVEFLETARGKEIIEDIKKMSKDRRH